jgi:hypothetical protein
VCLYKGPGVVEGGVGAGVPFTGGIIVLLGRLDWLPKMPEEMRYHLKAKSPLTASGDLWKV